MFVPFVGGDKVKSNVPLLQRCYNFLIILLFSGYLFTVPGQASIVSVTCSAGSNNGDYLPKGTDVTVTFEWVKTSQWNFAYYAICLSTNAYHHFSAGSGSSDYWLTDAGGSGESCAYSNGAHGSDNGYNVVDVEFGTGFGSGIFSGTETVTINVPSSVPDGDYYIVVMIGENEVRIEQNAENYQDDGSTANYFKVSTSIPAEITTEPVTPREILDGDSVIFSVAADGTPAPSYQWEKQNGASWDPVGGNVDTFTINPVAAGDEGVYRVRVWNVIGSVTYADTSVDIELTVGELPVITANPEPDTVLKGQDASFSVTATGKPLTYQWQRMKDAVITDIPGANDATCTFTTAEGDDGTYYRCIVSACDTADTSLFAMLRLGSIPSMPDQFPPDTVLRAGMGLTLSGSATGLPSPSYEWFYIHPPSSTPVSKGTGATLSMTDLDKGDSGIYYFAATNKFGSTSSDSIFVHVCTPVSIINDLPTVYTVIDGGEAKFSITVSGDGTFAYQWYENSTAMNGENTNALSINPVDSAIHDGNTYFCETWNTVAGKVVGIDTSNVCTIQISKYYNPFKVSVQRVSDVIIDQVMVKLWSDVDISNFPSTQSLLPWADSVWVIYKTLGYPPDLQNAVAAMFSTEEIKKANDTLVRNIDVTPLKPGGTEPFFHDSCYWFSYSVLWHDPGNPDTLLTPYATANKVFMIDTLAPQNPLVVHGEYVMKTDTIKAVIDSITKLDSSEHELVIVQCSKFPEFSPLMFTDTLSVSTLLAGGDKYTLILIDSADVFPLKTPSGLDTVFCKWYIIGGNGAIGIEEDTSFTIGWERPVYTGTLTADSTFYGGQLFCGWNSVPADIDSIKLWWDTDTIPLYFEFSIPASQSKTLAPNVTKDTLKSLDNDKLYCVALQVKKDDMWSMVTAESRAWAKTAVGDTSKVPNIIRIDSAWFDSIKNNIVVSWHIDTLDAPGGRTYEAGYVVGFDSAAVVDTGQTVESWAAVTSKINQTKIPLYPDIVFDTTYTVGLWLRGVSDPLGPGKSSAPTDSSISCVRTPKFSWQEVTLFTDTADTVYVANHSIFFIKNTVFTIVDTLWAFTPDSLPVGFVDVGCIGFKFNNEQLQIPPILLGMKYDSLPDGVSESDLGLYKYENGKFYVMHGFTVHDSAVWATMYSEDLTGAFLVLADTLSPAIIVHSDTYNDTVIPGAPIPTRFTIRDNVANVAWQFAYGPGNDAYKYFTYDTLETPVDTTLKGIILDKESVINESFGVRALIVADDGVHLDTVNVSRCVYTEKEEVVSVVAREWIPLRTTRGLEQKELGKIFNNSIETTDSWTYNTTQHRLYRWYDYYNNGHNDWLEYSDDVKDAFSFAPGRLIWLKSAEGHTVKFGAGVTTTLKEPFEIVLKGKDWTDITLPFQFSVMLRDILETTGLQASDSLFIYQWQKEGSVYVGDNLYNPKFDSVSDVTDTIISKQKYDGYTIYNNSSNPITLRIPPICLPLSQYSTPVRKEVTPDQKRWSIQFRWAVVRENDETVYHRVRCGYAEKEGRAEYGSLPPSMSKIRVGVLDNSRGTVKGWALEHSMDKKGGVSFTIALNNNSKKDVAVAYYLAHDTPLPEEYNAGVFNPAENAYEECTDGKTSVLTIAAGNSEERVLVVGTEEYFNHMLAALLPMKLLNVYPNPFNNRIMIHYRLPIGMREMRFTLYNLQGRKLWDYIEKKNMAPGEHIFHYNGNAGDGNRLPAGVYLLRMTAKNAAGKVAYGGFKRLTCIK